jgi:uncharacterized membrane protein
MVRQARMRWDKRDDMHFRWRGGEVSRLEAFSDAVFGFALTLLVVSLEVPHSFDDLLHAMRGFLAFAICFGMLVTVWERHYRFFRRFGLQDVTTMRLNAALLFVVLFYVYPLKFVMTAFVDGVVFHVRTVVITPDQAGPMFGIYGAGFAAVFLLFAAFYGYAFKRRVELELHERELFVVRGEIARNLALAALAGLSIALAFALPPRLRGMGGWAYMLIGAIETWHGRRLGTARARWGDEPASEPPAPESER